jgi:3-deoxy-D-manno-octulosonic acid kinase
LDTLSHYAYNGYHFGANVPVSSSHILRLVNILQAPGHAADAALEGRGSVSRIKLEGIGGVVVKHYRRGGMLAHLISKTYLKVGKPRSQLEYEQMRIVGRFGVQTPEPIIYAYKGGFFYRAWLVTREVEQSLSMAQLSRIAPERAVDAMPGLCQQMALLVANRIRHADFHPGNVLVDHRNQVYIIDFDKTGFYRGRKSDLEKIYKRRWCHAVAKHGLPSMLCELMGA